MASKKQVCYWLLYHQKTNWRKVREIWNGKFPRTECYKPLTVLEKIWMSAILIIEWLSLCQWLKWVFFPMQDKDSQPDNHHRRRCFVDFYALVSLLFVFVVLCKGWTHSTFAFVVAYLVSEMLVATVTVQLVDVYDQDNQAKSLSRSIVLLLFGYVTVTLAFAVFYRCWGCIVDDCGVVSDSGRLFYFSLMTIATVGYGDLHPFKSFWLCDLEVALGIVLVVVLLARFIALSVGGTNSTRQ
jgi:hypothetical protein